jgi:hypothetical protein
MTGTTMVLGWWGTISLILTPFFLLNNVGRYLFCLGMPGVPFNAAPPELTEEVAERLMPHANEIFDRLNAGESFERVATTTADKAGVSPGQVALFVQAIIQAHSSES